LGYLDIGQGIGVRWLQAVEGDLLWLAPVVDGEELVGLVENQEWPFVGPL
jgi:hypothetical protein